MDSNAKFSLDDNDLGDTVANDIFTGKMDFGDGKSEYDLTGEEFG